MEELSHQELLNYISEFIHVKYVQTECDHGLDWEIIGRSAVPLYHIRLMNIGKQPVVGGGWAIYFNHADGFVETVMVRDDDLVLQHVDGWLFKLTVLAGRILRPFSNMTMHSPVQLRSRSYVFPRWYTVFVLLS